MVGGLLGYVIGALLYDSVGTLAVPGLRPHGGRGGVPASYAEYGHWIILLKGLTPIPYKLVTITSGFAGYDLFWFSILSIITRGARFFFLAALIEPVRAVDQRRDRPPFQRWSRRCSSWPSSAGFVAFRYLF